MLAMAKLNITHTQVCVTGKMTLGGVVDEVGSIEGKIHPSNRRFADKMIIPSANAPQADAMIGEKLPYVAVDKMQSVLREVVDLSGKLQCFGVLVVLTFGLVLTALPSHSVLYKERNRHWS